MASDGFVSFLMGATGAGLFTKAVRPGSPTEFIDSRSVDEYLASGEFEGTLEKNDAYTSKQLNRHLDTKEGKVVSSAVRGHDAAVLR
jgi:hypothetical protein